jgi:peptidoglycan/LPS O-acetylase OafA/YrhL
LALRHGEIKDFGPRTRVPERFFPEARLDNQGGKGLMEEMVSKSEIREVSHLPFLDYLRGAAILSVFFFHCFSDAFGLPDQLVFKGWFRDFHVAGSYLALLPFSLGWLGVDLFFVISGFCIHLSHERARDKRLDVFFLRRFFRIYPPYLLALLIFAFCRLDFRGHWWESVLNLSKHLLLLENLTLAPSSINGAFWSVAAESQLYLLYPLLLFLAFRTNWRSVMVFTVTVSLLAIDIPFPPSRSPFDLWYSWAVGAALADAWLKREPLPFRRVPFYVWFLIALVCYFYRPVFLLTRYAFALGAVSVIAYCLEHPGWMFPKKRGFLMNHLHTTGMVSYSAYLLHMPMTKLGLIVFRKLFHFPASHPLVFALCVSSWLIIFPASYIFHHYVELPSIALGKWIIQRRRHVEFLSGDLPKNDAPA